RENNDRGGWETGVGTATELRADQRKRTRQANREHLNDPSAPAYRTECEDRHAGGNSRYSD
ncbi:MAG: hypothetical protein ACJ8AC_02230, partial [Gemmatimonadaceae bacterium]